MDPRINALLKNLMDHLLPHQRGLSPVHAAISVVLDGIPNVVEGWYDTWLKNRRSNADMIERGRRSVLLLGDYLAAHAGESPLTIDSVELALFSELLRRKPEVDGYPSGWETIFHTSPVENTGHTRFEVLRNPILSPLVGDNRLEQTGNMSQTPLVFDEWTFDQLMTHRDQLPHRRKRGTEHPDAFPQEQFFPERLIDEVDHHGFTNAVYADHRSVDGGIGRTFMRSAGCGPSYGRGGLAVMGWADACRVTDELKPRLVRHLGTAYGYTPKQLEDIYRDPQSALKQGVDQDIIRIAKDTTLILEGKLTHSSMMLECDMAGHGTVCLAGHARDPRFVANFNMRHPGWRHVRAQLADYLGNPTGGILRLLRDRNEQVHGNNLDSFLGREIDSEETQLISRGMSPVNYGSMHNTLTEHFLDMEYDSKRDKWTGCEPDVPILILRELEAKRFDLSNQDDRAKAAKWVKRNVSTPYIQGYDALFPWAEEVREACMVWFESELASAMANDGFPSASLIDFNGSVLVVPHYRESKKRDKTIRVDDPAALGPRSKQKTVQVTSLEVDDGGYGTPTKLAFGTDGHQTGDAQLSLHKQGHPSLNKFDCLIVPVAALPHVNSAILASTRNLYSQDVLAEVTGKPTTGVQPVFPDDTIAIRCGEE